MHAVKNMPARRTSTTRENEDDFITAAKKGKKVVKKEAHMNTTQAEGGVFNTVVTPTRDIDTSTGSGGCIVGSGGGCHKGLKQKVIACTYDSLPWKTGLMGCPS